MKQSSLAFIASFLGQAIVCTDNGEDTVVLISSALSTYLWGAGLGSLLNDAEAIEDYLLLSPGLDLTINADGFLLLMQRAVEPPAPSVETLNNSDEFLQEMLELAQPVVLPAPEETLSEVQCLFRRFRLVFSCLANDFATNVRFEMPVLQMLI
ncbi:hypothetical protein E1301_Tti023105 [Triplophysa tibetana]|uniref:Uncharacterized protein n=1 Tax=Triplophysa tibetana TaxID=1572043 RepID=A0A5A9MY67_9TELE|nr:hypothetical protein E1301_Tti023105 [Triplophysa tibetana]